MNFKKTEAFYYPPECDGTGNIFFISAREYKLNEITIDKTNGGQIRIAKISSIEEFKKLGREIIEVNPESGYFYYLVEIV